MTIHFKTTATLAVALTAVLSASVPQTAFARGGAWNFVHERAPAFGRGPYGPSRFSQGGRFGPGGYSAHGFEGRGFQGRGVRGGFEQRGPFSAKR